MSDGKEEISRIKENLADLYNLTDDEKTEEALLQARIEEQSSLIMMLKKRADEYIIRSQILDKDNKDLNIKLVSMSEQMKKDDKKHRIIQQNFQKLSQSYDELKNDYDKMKHINDALELEKEDLEREVICMKRQEKDSLTVAHLRKEMEKMTKSFEKMEDIIEKMKKKYQDEETVSKSNLDAKDKVIHGLQNQLNVALSKVESIEQDHLIIVDKILVEKKQLENDVMEMRKRCENQELSIKKQKEQLVLLTKKNKEVEKQYSQLKSKYEREEENLNVNQKINNLQSQLSQEEEKRQHLRDEYESYKAHSSKLLQTEKELNSRLRKLYS